MSSFSAALWRAGADAYTAILAHPFLAALADGSLERASFRYFIVQDSHYLRDYARALALCAARAPDQAATRMFAGHARDAIEVERELHAGLLAELGIGPDELAAQAAGPVTVAYTSYLLATCATGSFAEAVGAVLPCYWVYREVGKALSARSSPDPLYARWISTYGGEEFSRVVDDVIAATDRLGPELGDGERARAAHHYAVTTRYEWMFWDAAWARTAWPI